MFMIVCIIRCSFPVINHSRHIRHPVYKYVCANNIKQLSIFLLYANGYKLLQVWLHKAPPPAMRSASLYYHTPSHMTRALVYVPCSGGQCLPLPPPASSLCPNVLAELRCSEEWSDRPERRREEEEREGECVYSDTHSTLVWLHVHIMS